MKNKHQKCVFRPQSHTESHKFSSLEPQIQKKRCLIVILKAILFFCSYEGECRGHFGFFNLNLLPSNVYFWSTKLLQLNHVIVNMFSGNNK